MNVTALATVLAALAIAGHAVAAEPVPGSRLGASAAEIEAALAADGYQIRSYRHGGDRIDVTAVKDGLPLEIAVDPASGAVVRVETRATAATPTPGTAAAPAGSDDAAIRAALAGQGYEVLRTKREHGQLEVYATKGGRRWELKVDPATGQILRAEEEN